MVGDLGATETIKVALKAALAQQFDIAHSTLKSAVEIWCEADSGKQR